MWSCDDNGIICLKVKGTIQCFAFDLSMHFEVLLFRIRFFSKVKTSAFDKRHLMAPVLSDSRVISRDCFPQTLNKVGMEFVVATMIRMCFFFWNLPLRNGLQNKHDKEKVSCKSTNINHQYWRFLLVVPFCGSPEALLELFFVSCLSLSADQGIEIITSTTSSQHQFLPIARLEMDELMTLQSYREKNPWFHSGCSWDSSATLEMYIPRGG